MADIDIFNIAPNVVSKDLKGKIITFYGSPKSGKTSNACKFPKPLLIAFEKGYGAIAGIKPQPVNKWTEFKKVLKQLEKPEAHDIYETVIVDTVDIAFTLCEDYICQKEGVDKINDPDKLAYGAGYKMLRDEFFKALRQIAMMGYGLVMISHSLEKNIKKGKEEHTKVISSLNDRAKEIVFGMSDIIGYAKVGTNEENQSTTYLLMRETEQYEAGSRWKYLPDYIEFNYNNLVNAIFKAVEKEEEESGIKAIDIGESAYKEISHYDYNALMEEARAIFELLASKNDKYIDGITKIVDKHFGKGKKISELTEEQADILSLIVDDMRDFRDRVEGE